LHLATFCWSIVFKVWQTISIKTKRFLHGYPGASKKTADLEVCYINETAFDDDPIKEEDEEDIEEIVSEVKADSIEPGRFPRSKSDWEAFRNPTLLSLAAPKEERGNRLKHNFSFEVYLYVF